MRIRKQQRQTDEGGIPNGPPRPSIEAVKGAIEQLSPRDRWLVALWMRTIYVQRPPAKPTSTAAPQTKSRLRPKPDFRFGSYPKGGRR